VAAKLGFEVKAAPSPIAVFAPDYQLPGIQWAAGATALAGVVGALVAFGLAALLSRWLVGKQPERNPQEP
jgi:hypothetical protein